MNYEELSELSMKFISIKPSIIQLPVMRVLSSLSKEIPQVSDPDGLLDWLKENRVPVGKPGWHEQFEYRANGEDVVILRVDDEFINSSEYLDFDFSGGLFAVADSYVDDEVEEQINFLKSYFDGNKLYAVDYTESGDLQNAVMLETLISPDSARELISLFVPIQERYVKEGIE